MAESSMSFIQANQFEHQPTLKNKKLSKKSWTKEQINLLFNLHKELGNQWKAISKHFPGKKPNDVKNKFNSILKRKLRRIEKVLGNKHGTYEVKTIQPLVLTKILDQSMEMESCLWKEFYEFVFEFDESQRIISENQKGVLKNLIRKIYEKNDQYKKEKKGRYECLKEMKKSLRSSDKTISAEENHGQNNQFFQIAPQKIVLQNDQNSLGIFKSIQEIHIEDDLKPLNMLVKKSSVESRILEDRFGYSNSPFLLNIFEPTPRSNNGLNSIEVSNKNFTSESFDETFRQFQKQIKLNIELRNQNQRI